MPDQTETRIVRNAPVITVIDVLHVAESDQDETVTLCRDAAGLLSRKDGLIASHVLASLEGTRVVTYSQWSTAQDRIAAEADSPVRTLLDRARHLTDNDAMPRDYTVVYTDDRSSEGVSVISPTYTGAIFINEITTHPDSQDRLLELVIANNEIQSHHTPGYRSANFHQSRDGQRAVNYSLWDTADHCIQAISAMADMDENLTETLAIASPDFRFYRLVHGC